MKDTSLSGAFQTYSGQTGSAGAPYIKSVRADDENEESSRKRGRWEQADESPKCLINFDFNRTISTSPYPPSEHLLSLASLGSKVPLAADSADLELSIKASTSAPMQNMGHLKPCNFGSFNSSSYIHQRILNPHHHNDLIARLLAAASANSSKDHPNVQAFHTLNQGQLGMPLLAYNLPQGKQNIEQQGVMSRISNQDLTKVNPSTYTSQQGILRDDIMSNTTLFKPYNSMSNGTLANPYPYNNRKLYTSIESNDKEAGGLLKKVAMQKYVKVVMEGRSIERKVCLEDYDSYESFAKALFDMYGTQDIDKHLIMNVSHTLTNLHNAVPGYKIAYQDHEGDLLLAGDLPWREFIQVAKQIKILPVRKPKHHLSES